jgi:hypothetical protein
MSKVSREEMVEHLRFLGEQGIACSQSPCPFCDSIRDLILAVEKWQVMIINLLHDYDFPEEVRRKLRGIVDYGKERP